MHTKLGAADRDGCAEIILGDLRQLRGHRVESLRPRGLHIGTGEWPVRELAITIAPGLLTVRGEKIRETRHEIATDVAHDHRDRVAVAHGDVVQVRVGDLCHRLVANDPVAPVFVDEVLDQHWLGPEGMLDK